MLTPIQRRGLGRRLDHIDATVTGYLARHGVTCLRVSLGTVFLWFGRTWSW